MIEPYQDILLFLGGFIVVALAARQIGHFATRLHLPLISGFLFAGMLVGPYVLDLISEEAIESLEFVNETALAFIAFAAGSELYLQEIRGRLKSISWITGANAVVVPLMGSTAVFFLAPYIPFMAEVSVPGRVAMALIAGAILIARSPSSAIAIVNETRARGPFTQTTLGVTMVTDVIVIVFFAITVEIANALLTNLSLNLGFILLLVAEFVISLALGYLVGKMLQLALALPLSRLPKAGLILVLGYAVFIVSHYVREASHEIFSFELFLEPLLIAMIGSFIATNYSGYRDEFLKTLEDLAPAVYIAFFTLTGASLALDVLSEAWLVAVILFAVRLAAIFLGSFGGGILAGDPGQHNRLGWMAYVTQAGVGLGLAQEVAVEFPTWGEAFATLIISVIVISQIVGPPFYKWAIQRAGEAHQRGEPGEFDDARNAIIFGVEGQSLAVARQLQSHGWQVKVACLTPSKLKGMAGTDIDLEAIDDLTLAALHSLEAEHADAIVTMLSDAENYRICELAYEHFGTENLVVRLHERANFERFLELDALIVDPNTAIVSLLDHLVRSPSATSLILGLEEAQDVVEFEVRNPAFHGVALRDLRLPLDTLVMSVSRDGTNIISHGYTRLELGDRVTVVGSPQSLDEVMLRFAV